MVNWSMKKSYNCRDLAEIVRILRHPGGCPWDQEQTHASIRRNFLEEAYEVAEAIDKGDVDGLREELGDVLLQVYFHTSIEEDAGRFTLDDVADGVCKKLIYRHPHVFGDVSVGSTGEVLSNWEELKKKEKGQLTQADALEAVAASLPALWRAEKVLKKAVRAGAPCSLTADDGCGNAATVTGPPPEPAGNRALTAEDLSARLQKTGGTPYRCARADVTAEPGLYLSAAAVNALRRDALESLSAARSAPPVRWERFPPPPLPDMDCAEAEPQLTVSVLSAAQLGGGLLDFRPARVYVPLELLAGMSFLPEAETEYCAVLPRVWRDQDEDLLRRWLDKARDLGAAGLLLGNLGHFPLARGGGWRLYGDYGLNVFNSRSLDFLRKKGLDSACLSFELRFSQIRDMRKVLPAEAIVYGRLPLMITENCLVQNALGCRCGQPNFLNDRTGASFPLLPAFGHRTEVENSRPLYLADQPGWRRLGLAYARLRFTTESPEDCVQVCRAYLEHAAPAGEFTRGLYHRGVE